MTARARSSGFIAIVFVACTSSAPPAATPATEGTTTTTTTTTMATATSSITPPPSPSASATAAKGNGALSPSGFYHYAMHVVSDDCKPATQPVEEKAMMVFAHATAKGLLLNVPMIVQPTATGGVITVARTDLEATPGNTIHSVTKTGACAAADVHHTLVVKDVSRTLVVFDETSEHLDRSTCTPPGPPACATHVEVRLSLEEAKCEASCAATADMKAKPPQILCKCP